MRRRRHNPRYVFSSGSMVKLHARAVRRRRYLSPEQARATTRRMAKINPRRRSRRNPSNVFTSVVEAARAFKNRYGGQAVGWAQDAVSTARTAATAKFWQQVTALLRRDMYATNPRGDARGKHRDAYWKARDRRQKRDVADWSKRMKRTAKGLGLNTNPKRDGTPTRGEMRQGRYKDHLRALRERGAKAAAELNKLLGRSAPRGHEEPAFKAPQTETQLAHPGHYAAEESSDQKYIREQLASVNALMADLRDQIRDIGDDESLADGLSEQLTKLGKQRKSLMEMAGGSTATLTNPRPSRRGRFRFRRLHPARKAAYRRALRELKSALRSC